eukprot:gene14455-14568_t
MVLRPLFLTWYLGCMVAAAASRRQPAAFGGSRQYSGTSADLFKTIIDLMISLKLFLGRFDMRTMQELWFDFIADTGDGGNPTYAVARALAAPQLEIPVASNSPAASSTPAAAVAAAAKDGG